MAEQLFYPEDTVSLKADPFRIGIVDRTHGNPDTHESDPLSEYPNGLIKGPRISHYDYSDFLRNGIPPRGTILITWAYLPWSHGAETTLLHESDLKLEDRALLEGDIVKQSADSAVSGTVTRAFTKANLLQSSMWPQRQMPRNDVDDTNAFRNSFPGDPVHLLRSVPSNELSWSKTYQEDDFVLYNEWVGRITDIEEEPLIRLVDNSVVIPTDADDLVQWSADPGFHVGDCVSAKKSKLRRGRWIYGAYNADVEPVGYVADVRQSAITVEWLEERPSFDTLPTDMPPEWLDTDDLQHISVYDRSRRPPHYGAKTLNFELSSGDRVKFRDIAQAAIKYDGSTDNGRLHRILRSDSLGYDINMFLVVCTHTTVDVDWQDGTQSIGVEAISLVVPLDMDLEDILPGDIVCSKPEMLKTEGSDESISMVRRVGIAQKINSQDQVGHVRWMKDAELLITMDETLTLLPGSRTSELEDVVEEVSLYEIRSVIGLSRRMGDYVAIVPSSEVESSKSERYSDVRWTLSSSAASQPSAWFGEIISLGLDGLLTVRLGAANPVRDVRTPWENSIVIWSSDQGDDLAGDEYSDEEGSEMSEASHNFNPVGMAQSLFRGAFANYIRGGSDRAIDLDHQPEDVTDSVSRSSWETDDDPLSDLGDLEVDVYEQPVEDFMTSEVVDIEGNFIMSEGDDSTGHPNMPNDDTSPLDEKSDTFSYSTMFRSQSNSKSNEKVPSFEILDGNLPADHFFKEKAHNLTGKQLQRIMKEQKILSESLPPGAWVKTWESSLDCMRILLLGPLETPYEYAPFVFDLHLNSSFPNEPPQLYFHSWTEGQGPCNPNLYEDGKVCLSLLGTWPGDDKNDTWSKSSTILQIVMSLLGLVLNNEPYYNEAGYEVRKGSVESLVPARLYSERAYLRTRAFITHMLKSPLGGLEQMVEYLYKDRAGPLLLDRAISTGTEVINRSKQARGIDWTPDAGKDKRTTSAGAIVPLRRYIASLISFTSEPFTAQHRAALETALTELAH